IGIMNIMLVSIRERTSEIGLRKAVGAKRRDILWQFLVEAMALSVLGGLIGLLIGFVGATTIASLSDTLASSLDWSAAVLAIGFSAAVGLFFGIYPASRAASLNPIDALHYE
ncbi:MAG: ABC transporter permease, partial [Candidatus Promineifilaceae bacterium]